MLNPFTEEFYYFMHLSFQLLIMGLLSGRHWPKPN